MQYFNSHWLSSCRLGCFVFWLGFHVLDFFGVMVNVFSRARRLFMDLIIFCALLNITSRCSSVPTPLPDAAATPWAPPAPAESKSSRSRAEEELKKNNTKNGVE